MSESELKKILAVAAKHVLDESHLGKLEEAVKRHGKPFRTNCLVERVTDTSSFLKNAVKHE